LAVLHIDIATRILQAAVAESAVDEDPFVEDEVLIFEDLGFESVHAGIHFGARVRPRASGKESLTPRGAWRQLSA
jgi:hypothetical protein